MRVKTKQEFWGKSGTGRSQNSFREITGKVRTMPGGMSTKYEPSAEHQANTF